MSEPELLKLLLAKGAQVNIATASGRTPLHLAAAHLDKAPTELLLDHGANIEAQDATGMTVLHSAALAGKPSQVQLLLDRGAKVDTRDARGMTALHLAALNGHLGVVALLLDRGADPYAKDWNGSSLFDTPRAEGDDSHCPRWNSVPQMMLQVQARLKGEPSPSDSGSADASESFHSALYTGSSTASMDKPRRTCENCSPLAWDRFYYNP
jgi:hypothetical protein